MSLPSVIHQIREEDWYPQSSAFQVYPRKYPSAARHSLMRAASWKRIAEEVHSAFGLYPIGNDGTRWVYFGDWTYSR